MFQEADSIKIAGYKRFFLITYVIYTNLPRVSNTYIKMTFKCFFVFLNVWLVTLPLFAQEKNEESINAQRQILALHPNNGDALKKIVLLYLHKGDYSRAIYYGTQLKNLGDSMDNDYYRMYSYICLGQALMMEGKHKSAKYYLDKSLKLSLRLKNDSALCSVYNGLGLYASNVETDYYKSINYYMKGIAVAKRCSNDDLYSIMLTNMAGVYYLKKDTAGLKYSLECYDLGHEQDNAYLIYSGATNSAYMYFLKKNYSEALKYVQEAEFVMTQNKFYNQSNVYNLFGNILSAMRDYSQAIAYFKKALEQKQFAQTSTIADTYLRYAKTLMAQRKYSEAIPLLKQGVGLSKQKGNAIFLSELYESISECYAQLHLYQEALSYYQAFKKENDLLFNAEKERSLNEMRVKYDMIKQENELKQSKLLLLQKERKIQLMTLITIITILILGYMYFVYQRKQGLYKQIVRQNQDALKKEEKLQLQIEQLIEYKSSEKKSDKYALSSLTDEKSTRLFLKVETLMKDKKIFMDKDITKEKLADMLNTNRSYLSQVINEKYGSSFSHYINSFRVEEAIRILSDPNNNTPLKALAIDLGFNSITTFYSVFKAKVGMTPSTYRSTVLEIKNGD